MAEVILPEHVPSYPATFDSMEDDGASDVEVTGVGESSDSIQPRAHVWSWQRENVDLSRRPASASMRIDIPSTKPNAGHARAVSVLPNFTFNSTDVSGRRDSHTPPRTPDETPAVTPSRTGHRRGGSEFVGGDSRFGVSNAVSSSPTKMNSKSDLSVPVTGTMPARRGHAHRRSAAISSNDIAKVMQPFENSESRLSSSLPNSPLEYPGSVVPTKSLQPSNNDIPDPFGPPLDNYPARPPSRPRVGFSDNVEFIPRPLSTISSETESSLSTIRGHSVNNSISSMLSLSTPSPPVTRMQRIPLRPYFEDGTRQAAPTSPLKPRRVDKEGTWLKKRSSESLKRPVSESAALPRTAFVDPEPICRSGKRSFSYGLGFDRRKSEPSFNLNGGEMSRLSAISLQEASSNFYVAQTVPATRDFEHKSSVRRMKDWAASKISKKAKEAQKTLTTNSSSSSLRPASAGSIGNTHVSPPLESSEPAVAETDLDAVLSHPDTSSDADRTSPSQALVDINAAVSSQYSGSRLYSHDDDSETMLDLDAALGPFKTPPIGSHRHRKEMHSSRLTRDFAGSGLHYHRRAESAPILQAFEYQQGGNASQSEMADVFEEEEEDAANISQSTKATSSALTTANVTDQGRSSEVFDFTGQSRSLSQHRPEGLGLQEAAEVERNLSSLNSSRPMLSNLVFEGRGTSIIEETILEEPSQLYSVEIVDADEEPRASSLTKSSDSSDTPTLLVPPSDPFSLADVSQSTMTSDSHQSFNYSSPIIRPGSLSSCTTGEQSHDMRLSVEVPSLVSSRSTMISTVHDNGSRRDISDPERAASVTRRPAELSPPNDLRRKRGSIQSLSQLVGGTFGAKFGSSSDIRPQTSGEVVAEKAAVKKENRLKKLVFWRTKRQP